VSPIALEAVKRIDTIFTVERQINGMDAGERSHIRQEQSRRLVESLHAWLQEKRVALPRSSSVAKRWTTCSSALTASPSSSTTDVCLTNNAAERALRGFAMPD